MPEVNNVSPVLPVAAATPVQGSAGNSAVSQGNDGQSAFSQVLRDKQAAANAKTNSPDSVKPQAKEASGKAENADGKTDAAPKDDTAGTEELAKTPAEMAQLLVSAGLMANTQTTTTASADKSADQLAIDAASQTATDPNVMAVLPKTEKTAATSAATAASLAAGTATTTNTAEQTLAAQSQLAKLDNKGNQAGTSSGEQQAADKPLLAVAGQNDADKTAAAAAESEASFSAALERASQNGEPSRSGATPLTGNVTQTQAAQNPATTHTVATPVGRQGWADEVGQRVLWTAKSDSSRADLILTPPQLGRIEVSIHMNGDQANASFMVANPVAREALQDAMPKLRELMSQAGIQLGQADVSAGQSGQDGSRGGRRQASGGTGMLGTDVMVGTSNGSWTRQGTGIVDTFA